MNIIIQDRAQERSIEALETVKSRLAEIDRLAASFMNLAVNDFSAPDSALGTTAFTDAMAMTAQIRLMAAKLDDLIADTKAGA